MISTQYSIKYYHHKEGYKQREEKCAYSIESEKICNTDKLHRSRDNLKLGSFRRSFLGFLFPNARIADLGDDIFLRSLNLSFFSFHFKGFPFKRNNLRIFFVRVKTINSVFKLLL